MAYQPPGDTPPPDWKSFDPGSQDQSPEAWLRDLKTATLFFTRIPIEHTGPLELGNLARAWRAAPVIGVLIGLAGGIAFAIATKIGLPPVACGFLAVMATMALTGALHEDGLADFADGCGGATPEDRIEIMRDSRIGAYGALALMCSLGLRVAALTALSSITAAAAALIVAHAVSGAALPAVMDRLGPAGTTGLGAGAGQPDRTSLGIALVIALILALLMLGPMAGIVALLTAAAAAALIAGLAQRLIGGYTGDVLGAAQQAVEITVLLAAVAAGIGR